MKRLFSAIARVICIAMVLPNMSHSNGNCYSSRLGNSKGNFPDSVSLEEVYKATGLSPTTCGMTMKKWSAKDSSFIVYSEDSSHYAIHVLKQRKSSFEAVAKYTGDIGEYRFEGFDFAPYKIKKNQNAIGMTFAAKGPAPGGMWECTLLRLYEIRGAEISHILSTIIKYRAEGNDIAYDGDTHFYEEESAVVIIGKPDKSGYNKLIIKSGKEKTILPYANGAYATGEGADCLGAEKCFCP